MNKGILNRVLAMEAKQRAVTNANMPRVPVLYYKGERTHGEKIALNETTNGVEAVRRGLRVGKAILCQEMSDEVWEQQAAKQQSELLGVVQSESERRKNAPQSSANEYQNPMERPLHNPLNNIYR